MWGGLSSRSHVLGEVLVALGLVGWVVVGIVGGVGFFS